IHEYSTWQGPFPSGINETMSHTWTFSGDIDVRVRARDIWLGPDFSNWSEPWHLNLAAGCEINAASQVLLGANAQYYAMVYDATEPIQNYTWNFNYPSRATQDYAYVQNPYHTYSTTNTYTQTLNVTDALGHVYTCNHTIQVLNVIAGYTTNRTGAPPNNRIRFNDTSTVYSGASLTNWTWNFGDQTPLSYSRNTTHSYATTGAYNVTLTAKDTIGHTNIYWQIFHIDTTPPAILESTYSPTIIVPGSNLSLFVNFFDNESTVNQVNINITTPNNTTGNCTMSVSNTSGYDYEYLYNQTWQLGQYNFTIWVTDHANNTNSSSGCYFTVIRAPYINFSTPPTPTNQSIFNHNWVLVNTTILDTYPSSALIDWNRSLKGYWPMDFSNSTGVYDNSTYHNFGKFEGGMTPSSVHQGKYGKSMEFDGTNNDLDLGVNNSLHLGTGNFTFIVWENSDQTSYTHKAVILTNRPADASAKGYIFGLQNTTYLYVTQAAGNNVTLNGHADVTDHTWHHIAYVRRGMNYSIYVDGAYDAGITGAAKNITNTQHTSLAYGHWSNNAYFDGLLDEPQLYNRALSREEINASYNNGLYRLTHNFTGLSDGIYQYYAHAIDTTGNQSTTEMRQVTIDTTPPSITTINATPNTVGFGYNVTITTNVTDSISGVKNVSTTISYPAWSGLSSETVAMTHISGTMYRYIFSNIWHAGRYNYTIIAYDNMSNMRTSTGHSFNVTVNAMMSIATLKDSYTGNQYINITDPPNPPENLTIVGRGLTWNTYYNESSGTNILESYQGPVNYREDNGSWTPINVSLAQLTSDHPAYTYGYRIGNNHGLFGVYFKPNIQSDWPVAFTYNRSMDPTTYVVRSRLVGVGYLDPASNWAYHYLQTVQSSQGQTSDYSIIYPSVFTGTNVTWSYEDTELKEAITMSNATKTVLQNHPPSQYGLHDASSYLVFITKLDYQTLNLYNTSGFLSGNVTVSDTGVDLRDAFGCFKCGLPLGDAYEVNNESVRQKLTYRIVHLHGETYLLSGIKIADLSAMTFPVVIDPTLTLSSSTNDERLCNHSTNYLNSWNALTSNGMIDATHITIGQSKQTLTYYIHRGFVFFNTSALPSNAIIDNATLSLYKSSDSSATDFLITLQNGQPTYPHDPPQTGDYSKTHYSGNGGTLSTAGFGNGYNNISLNNDGISWINRTGWTKLCLRSNRDINGTTPTGNEYVTV
ncbi:MAG TPA: LamG-like jellyroll fold domain-containing protein, partial [Candidatus Thermoplasmatota archaeon]|nr:LamG-like jellyroll fold domain-containing protein [Candidatus Thermoplasmatota archaeon]